MSSVIEDIVLQHIQDAAFIHATRTKLTVAPHVRLLNLQRFDDRLVSHLDGLAVSGEEGRRLCDHGLQNPTRSNVFSCAVLAIQSKSAERLNLLYALAEAVPEAKAGLISAFGWVEKEPLKGVVLNLLSSSNSFQRLLGITVCSVQRVDPGGLHDALHDKSLPSVRARSFRAAGELGRQDLLPICVRASDDDDEVCRFWARWSAVLLGNRGAALEGLSVLEEAPLPLRSSALRLTVQAMDQSCGHAWLRGMAQNPENIRSLIQSSGIAGDSMYVTWLIQHMSDAKTARLAGEAFSLITGLDLAYLDLERKPPEQGGAGPNDDRSDDAVDMDEDDGLPWPDPKRIARWWEANGGRFSPGTRYFVGAPVTRENALKVLKEGFQRHRILAAHYLCLLEPGTVLFEWRAPAARQQRLLAAMG